MEKGNILTNAKSFARHMCSTSRLPQSLKTNSYHLIPPPDNKPQQVLGKEETGFHLHTSGSRLCSQRANPMFDPTRPSTSAGLVRADTHQRLHFR